MFDEITAERERLSIFTAIIKEYKTRLIRDGFDKANEQKLSGAFKAYIGAGNAHLGEKLLEIFHAGLSKGKIKELCMQKGLCLPAEAVAQALREMSPPTWKPASVPPAVAQTPTEAKKKAAEQPKNPPEKIPESWRKITSSKSEFILRSPGEASPSAKPLATEKATGKTPGPTLADSDYEMSVMGYIREQALDKSLFAVTNTLNRMIAQKRFGEDNAQLSAGDLLKKFPRSGDRRKDAAQVRKEVASGPGRFDASAEAALRMYAVAVSQKEKVGAGVSH